MVHGKKEGLKISVLLLYVAMTSELRVLCKCDVKPATLLKVTLLYGCFSRFLNCANGTKSRNASQMITFVHLKYNFLRE